MCVFLVVRHIHISRYDDASGFLCVSRTRVLPVRKVFFSKDQFVKLSANPHSAAFREHHRQDNIRFHSLVHIYFSSIFKPCLARIMPCYKQANVDTHASKTHAKPFRAMQCLFAPFSTTLPKRGKTRRNGIIIETGKYDQQLPIITYRQ